MDTHKKADSVLDKNVSRFANATHTAPETESLLDWLTEPKTRLQFLVDQIRASPDKYQRDQFKKQLPAITPSGIFTERRKSGLVQHSGLIAFDIDNIGDSASDIKAALSEIPNIAYCGLSVSGQGLWGLIPISNADKHEAHFRAIELAFAGIGITIDKACKDVSRLRFYSYDSDAYINHNAVVFDQVYYDPVPQPTHRSTVHPSSNIVIQRAVKLIMDAPDGQKYFNLNKASFLLGGYIGVGLIEENEARGALRSAIGSRSDVADINAAYRTIDIGLKEGQLKPVRL